MHGVAKPDRVLARIDAGTSAGNSEPMVAEDLRNVGVSLVDILRSEDLITLEWELRLVAIHAPAFPARPLDEKRQTA
ncbi:hypothetical protein BAY60_32430 [Prauserella muralis]|uniref:Uncharacterized protein n=1 Tax=Prauserella muralis TaxID=588067 RepID=A0A2V4AHU4_9PSEU|nr:hypothetical protein BAY60_32430 [Prauserella muralis]